MADLHPSDYRVATRDFETMFAGHHHRGRGFSLGGKNFMTPDILGFVTAPGGEIVEISTGMGFRNDRLFGVTYERGRNDPPDERDDVFPTLHAAYQHIYEED